MKPCGYQWGEGVGTDERAISKALRGERNFKEASVPVTDGGGMGIGAGYPLEPVAIGRTWAFTPSEMEALKQHDMTCVLKGLVWPLD